MEDNKANINQNPGKQELSLPEKKSENVFEGLVDEGKLCYHWQSKTGSSTRIAMWNIYFKSLEWLQWMIYLK